MAVESVTLSVAAGECVAVIGPNGHGKSSMVTAVAGLVRRERDGAAGDALPPERADAAVRGGRPDPGAERRHLYPELPVRDNIHRRQLRADPQVRGPRRRKEDVSYVLDMFPEAHPPPSPRPEGGHLVGRAAAGG